VTLTWAANGESDLAGYKIYVGTASGIYDFPVSAFVIGKVTSYTVANLPIGQTYFFAMSAYDTDGNESSLSAEVSKSLF
jgi:fibronectin type 3 domain-containing protein